MKDKLKIILPSILVLVLMFCFKNDLEYKIKLVNSKQISNINLDGINKLMIVAHPDDEMLWGGEHLIKDNYLVVCITCGSSKKRVEEFEKVMKETNDKYMMLNYPDKTNGQRDNWDNYYKKIEKDIKKIINYKDWNLIVTHNKNGEYGHTHHNMTYKIVTDNINNKNLYYFGEYYKKNNIPNDLKQINNLKEKEHILKKYITQGKTIDKFKHMNKYENWTKYEKNK